MKPSFRKTSLAVALSAAFGVSTNLHADTITMTWSGAFTMLSPTGQVVYNPDITACYPGNTASPSQCARTAITGTLTIDTVSGTGSGTLAPFSWFGSGHMAYSQLSLQTIGDGMGGPGTLMLGNMDFTWNANYGVPVSIVWDASGLLSAIDGGVSVGQPMAGGALPASDNTVGSITTLGPALLATTVWNTTPVGTPTLGSNPSGTLPLVTDTVADATNGDIGIGGNPMVSSPWGTYNANIDIVSATVTSVVPVPGAVWLFGSGLAGLVSLARRRRG